MKSAAFNRYFSAMMLLALLVGTAIACKQSLTKKVNYSGQVVGQVSGAPLKGVVVTLEGCGGGSGDAAPYGCLQGRFK